MIISNSNHSFLKTKLLNSQQQYLLYQLQIKTCISAKIIFKVKKSIKSVKLKLKRLPDRARTGYRFQHREHLQTMF